MQKHMDQLLDLAEVMTPTLDMNDRATLKESIGNLNERLVAVTTDADGVVRALESRATNWTVYQVRFYVILIMRDVPRLTILSSK